MLVVDEKGGLVRELKAVERDTATTRGNGCLRVKIELISKGFRTIAGLGLDG